MYNLSNKLELGNVLLSIGCYCSGCDKDFEPYTLFWSDGEYWYCMDCAKNMEGFDISKKEMGEINLKVKDIKEKIKKMGKLIGVLI